MRKIIIIIAIVFAVIGIVFTILPMGTLALLPNLLALALAVFALFLSKGNKQLKKLPFIIIIVAALASLTVVGKSLLVKDEVAPDKQFEQKKIQSEKEDVKDLEGLQ
jgi:hypothetical protein